MDWFPIKACLERNENEQKKSEFLAGLPETFFAFHPEVNEERVKSLIERFGAERGVGPYIRKNEELFGQVKNLAESKKFLFSILDKFESQL